MNRVRADWATYVASLSRFSNPFPSPTSHESLERNIGNGFEVFGKNQKSVEMLQCSKILEMMEILQYAKF